ITAQTLVAGRRYAIVLIFIVAAVLTPPDVISQFALACPLIILYESAILSIRALEKKQK
ncbi:MAG TPA: twin-arginine translocase subunit TatC, partial [Alphaproteobacteria bacterium]|nr:twin-arginine translocase subunit TatC [Alphaproteobacteria bacterium]